MKGQQMSSIKTAVVEVHNKLDGTKITPVFECHGQDKFYELVYWYRANLPAGSVATLKGFDYNNPNPLVITYAG
jgi:hypothetical protein